MNDLPYAFDLWFGIKTKPELANMLFRLEQDLERLREMMDTYDISVTDINPIDDDGVPIE